VTSKRVVLAAAVLALVTAGRLAAQPAALEGKWWKRPVIARRLELTNEQIGDLEKIFAKSKPKLIDLRADLEKKQFAYEQAMQAEKVDRREIEARIEARETARAALQKELALMELDMKQVLRPDQRERLAQMRENAQRMMQQRRRRMREEAADDDYPPAAPKKPTPR
jgi:Spy/CpxP family protein refolding chaperone